MKSRPNDRFGFMNTTNSSCYYRGLNSVHANLPSPLTLVLLHAAFGSYPLLNRSFFVYCSFQRANKGASR